MEWRSDSRGLSTLTEILLWGIVGLVALSILLTLVGIAVSIIVSVLSVVVPILALGAIIYLAIRYLSSDDEPAYRVDEYGFGGRDRVEADSTPQSPQDRLTEQYVRGEISEAEYERRLERHLDEPGDPSGRSLDDLETDSSRGRDRDREFR